MLLFLSLFIMLLAIILLYFNARNYTSSVYLGIFFFLISLYGVNHYVIMYSSSVFWMSIFFGHFAVLFYLIGPMSYLYVRSVLTDNSRLRKNDLWHLVPVVVYLVAVIPYLIAPYTYKTAIAEAIVKNRDFMMSYQLTFLSRLFSNQLLYLSRPLLVLLYAFGAITMYLRYKKQKRDSFIKLQQNFMEKWLLLFLSFQIVLGVSLFALIFKSFTEKVLILFYTINALQILSATGLIGLLISPFLFPQVLYGLPRLPVTFKMQHKEEQDVMSPEIKKNVLDLHSDYIQYILQKTEACMMDDQLFLQPNYNLLQFSHHIQVPVHHLGYFFREFREQSFNDFRNECRVNFAKSLLNDGKASELTLEAIGFKSGFANRQTFFRAFKKVEGISPGTYLAEKQTQDE